MQILELLKSDRVCDYRKSVQIFYLLLFITAVPIIINFCAFIALVSIYVVFGILVIPV